jgi:hypothetical protein
MRRLTKAEALQFVKERRDVIDAPGNPLNPFASSAWVKHFIEEVVQDDWTLMVPEAAGDGRSQMLLYADPKLRSRCLPLANFYTSLYSPLASTATDRAKAMYSIVSDLSTARPRLSVVTFAPLDATSEDTLTLASALADHGWFVRRYFCFGNWTLPCSNGSFDDYMASRDSQLRNTYQRKSKKMLSSGSIEIVTDVEHVDAAMTAYETIYAKSWKRPEPYPNFARGWARRCAEEGWLRLGVARVGGVPIAAQLWFVFGGRGHIFKLAYDETYAQWSAGTVLTAHMLRHAIEIDRVAEVDFLTGDDQYKRTWMTRRRERVGLIACNLRSSRGIVAAAAEFGGRATSGLRSRVRQYPDRLAGAIRAALPAIER